MSREKYDAAVKEVKATKVPDNFITISFSYDTKFLLTHKAGIALLAALENAELLKDGWSEKCRILPLERDSFTCVSLSAHEYQQIKIANLLDISLEDLKALKDSQ